ncbi:DMT family transporter [Paracoccus pacificus]|uniref:DMT family transporter n=1 Tax=Paracoccus pacificus TaxID=1463598 RepID=A0ABW4R4M6_9RHOB
MTLAAGGSARTEQSRGILLLLGAVLIFTLMDATAKYLSQLYHPLQVVWFRYAGNLAILLIVFAPHLREYARSRSPWLQFWRALMQIASAGLFFFSLVHIGLTEATAIMDLNPVLITLGAAVFLGEQIGPRRAVGILVSMVGALIIIRPGLGVFQPAAILPLIGAFTYAAGAILTRLVRGDSTRTSVLWSAGVCSLVASAALPFIWQPIQLQHFWAFGLMAVFGTISQVLLIRAFAVAEASAIAPFGYTGLVWAGVWSWLFFDSLPDMWTVVGAAVIVCAGIYVWSRERQQ